MSDDADVVEKRRLISLIIQAVKAHATATPNARQPDGDMLFALAFRSVVELRQIAENAGLRLSSPSITV